MGLFKKKANYYVVAIQWFNTGSITNGYSETDNIAEIAKNISENTGKVWNKDFGIVNVMPQL